VVESARTRVRPTLSSERGAGGPETRVDVMECLHIKEEWPSKTVRPYCRHPCLSAPEGESVALACVTASCWTHRCDRTANGCRVPLFPTWCPIRGKRDRFRFALLKRMESVQWSRSASTRARRQTVSRPPPAARCSTHRCDGPSSTCW